MKNKTSTSRIMLIVAAFVLLVVLMAGCRGTPGVTPEAVQEQPPTFGRTLSSNTGAPLSGYLVSPQSVQDLVNRYDVAFTGTIRAVGQPVKEKPYDWDPELDAHLQSRGLPPFRIRVTYYDITLENIYLDDGNLSQYPRLRLFGDHSSIRPQVGERFLFVLGANPDGKSYGLTADWNLIHLDGGPIRNFDGKSTGYVGVVDEGSLKGAVRAAVPKRVHLPMDQWPVQQKWLADENTPSGTPPSPGGDGATGPVGVASE